MPDNVIDASVWVDALVNTGPRGHSARSELQSVDELHVPAIFSAEVVSALRRLRQTGAIEEFVARRALFETLAVRMVSYPFEPFAERAWQLKDTLTVYDAWYVALAEQLQTTLVTADERLLSVNPITCSVRSPGDR